MNPAFDEVLAAGPAAMLSAFDTTAQRLGTASQNIEKDFWVCWTLDALFNGLSERGPRLLFKGGTSLSKGFGLINRFSEDIDVTVFRDDIGEPATIEELNVLSRNKRGARLDAIKEACQAYINGPLRAELTAILRKRLQAAGLSAGDARVEADDADSDGQTLLIWYPAAMAKPESKSLSLGIAPPAPPGESCDVRNILKSAEARQDEEFSAMVSVLDTSSGSKTREAADTLASLHRSFGDGTKP